MIAQEGRSLGMPRHGDRYFTFDDGPAEDTHALLDTLARHRAKATFFLTGPRVEEDPGTVRRMVREGHVAGNHGWEHSDLRVPSLHAIRAQLARTSDAIEAACGARPTLFRPPYGLTSKAIASIAASLGMGTVLWDVDTHDWRDPGSEEIAAAILAAAPGSVLLLHDGPAARGQTLAGVQRALALGHHPSPA